MRKFKICFYTAMIKKSNVYDLLSNCLYQKIRLWNFDFQTQNLQTICWVVSLKIFKHYLMMFNGELIFKCYHRLFHLGTNPIKVCSTPVIDYSSHLECSIVWLLSLDLSGIRDPT